MTQFKQILKPLQKPIKWFRQTSLRNKLTVVVVAVMAGILIVRNIQAADAKPQYITQPVERADIVEIVSETGNVDSSGRVDVFSTSTGIIEEIYVANGDQVEINQNLFKVRSTATDQEKASAWASYQNAVSAQKTAEQNKQSLDVAMWTAHKTLLDARETKRVKDDNKDDYEDLEQQSIDAALVQAEKNFAVAEQKYKEADTAINFAKAQVNSTWLAYQATQNVIVKAPAAGTVSNLLFQIGDKVAVSSGVSTLGGISSMTMLTSSSQSAGTTPVLIISNLNDYTVKLTINEVDVPKVQPEQKVLVTLDAFQDKNFEGSVTHVDRIGTNNTGVVTFNVFVAITNPDPGIRPGMTANVEIEVDKADDVLTVPNSAIRPYKGGKAVRIIDPNTNEMLYIPVTLGVKGNEKTEITEGVEEGMEVITSLQNGQVERSETSVLGGGR